MHNSKNEYIEIAESQPPTLLLKLANPMMKLLLKSPLHGWVDEDYILLRWRGRRTGNRYSTPVGYHQDGSKLTVFSFSGWRANFEQPHPAEVKLKGRWRTGVGVLERDPRTCAAFIRDSIGDGDLSAYRWFRMQIVGDRHPTIEELVPEVEKRDMALVFITLEEDEVGR
ncbi:MAG: hypothetical protein ACLFWD_03705 [Anaerolineales bacterium]